MNTLGRIPRPALLVLAAASAFFLLVPLALPAGAQAELVVGTDPEGAAIVPAGEVRQVVTLLFGRRATVDGEVADLVTGAETIVVGGVVRDNAFVTGKSVTVPGTVGGDLLFFGETATVTGTVEGDVYFFGKTLVIAAGCAVLGNIIAGGEAIVVHGAVGGDVKAFAGRLELAGPVGRGVNATVGALSVAEGARIAGDLRYTTPEAVEIPAGAVAGSVTHEPPAAGDSPDRGIGLLGTLLGHLALYAGTLLLGIALLRFLPPALLRPAAALAAAPARAIAYGFIGAIVLTALCALGALLTAGGLAVGSLGRLVALGGVWLAPFWLALPVVGLCAGEWFHRRVSRRGRSDVAALATGLLLLQALGAIPFLGTLAAIGVGCAGLGGMILAGRDSRRDAAPLTA